MPMSKIAQQQIFELPHLTAHKDVIDDMSGHLR